jgi:MFS family permease
LLAIVYVLGIILISTYVETPMAVDHKTMNGRPLFQIMRSPTVILAVGASAVGYGVMSFVMTAGPVSMHEHAGHDMQATKWVLQSHIAAMYLPSLIYPWLFSKLGYKGLMWTGVTALLLCLVIGSINTDFIHYWLTMVILGIGWNFMFLSGTNLLRHGYRDEERFKVQSFNDFLVFSMQGVASLSSGWFLYHFGWQGVLYASAPLILAFALLAWFSSVFRNPAVLQT